MTNRQSGHFGGGLEQILYLLILIVFALLLLRALGVRI